MIGLNEIKNTLDTNPSLTEMKENMMELITIFHTSFPQVDLANLNERLKTLTFLRGSKFLIHTSSFYDPIANEILLNKSKLTDDVDGKHILMRELLNIITAKDNYTGFNKDHAYEALNIGYTEILTNFLVGNEYESEFEDEIIATNMIAGVVGNDTLFQAYFNNDVNLLLNVVS